jgi:hypothetical protein
MTPRIDQLLDTLRDQPVEGVLEHLEPLVWARIGRIRPQASRGGVWGWRAAVAASMLAIGALTSAAATAPAQEMSPFAVHAELAPSTLLEAGR